MGGHRGNNSEIQLKNCRFKGHSARVLLIGGAMESATYRERPLRNELIFPYLRQIEQAFTFRPGIRDTLLIGGGACAYPKYYISRYPERSIDVIEIRRDVIEMARSAFYLDELIREEGMDPDAVFGGGPARLRIFCEDGMDYLLRSGKKYDLIINDAFDGKWASGSIGSEDGMRLVRSHLNPDGLYLINVVGAKKGIFASRGKKLMKRLQRHFRWTAMIPCDEERPEWELQNYLVFASNKELFE